MSADRPTDTRPQRPPFWMRFGDSCALDNRDVVHAIRTPRQKTRRKTWDTACGRRARILALPIAGDRGGHMTLAWPLYASQAKDWGYARCADCLKLAPGKPVKVDLAPAPAVVS